MVGKWIYLDYDNEEVVYDIEDKGRVIIYHNGNVQSLSTISLSIHTMAKYGGYYFYIAPEFNIDCV